VHPTGSPPANPIPPVSTPEAPLKVSILSVESSVIDGNASFLVHATSPTGFGDRFMSSRSDLTLHYTCWANATKEKALYSAGNAFVNETLVSGTRQDGYFRWTDVRPAYHSGLRGYCEVGSVAANDEIVGQRVEYVGESIGPFRAPFNL
jgi:hypothetical protein